MSSKEIRRLRCGGKTLTRLVVCALLAQVPLAASVAAPANAITACTNDNSHCYATLTNGETNVYSGMSFTQARRGISTQNGAWHVSSEAWFGNHCLFATWVELGIIEYHGTYEVFYADGINFNQLRFTVLTTIAQNPNIVDTYYMANHGDGRALVQLDGIFQAYTDSGTGFNGSCLQMGGEVYSNNATTATFDMVSTAFNPQGAPENWGTPQVPSSTPGMNGKSYYNSEWQWNAP